MGLVHGELTALLWGGAFGFVWAYAVVAGWVARAWVRAPQGTVTVTPDALVFHTPKVPTAPALFAWSLVVEGRHSPQRRWSRTRPLGATVTVDVDAPRGRYATTVGWELTDAFGFTRSGPRHRWTADVVVPPAVRPLAAPLPPAVRPGTWRPRRTGRRAGDPFDVRRYHPGDDLRRLHWALYAHSGVPFVRTADPSPPPLGRWHLVVDTEATSEDELDHRLGALAWWLTDLDAQGTPWLLEVPAGDVSVRAGQDWRSALAALSPARLPAPNPGTNQGEVLLVTGTQGSAAVLWPGARRVVVESPAPAAPTKRPWWGRR